MAWATVLDRHPQIGEPRSNEPSEVSFSVVRSRDYDFYGGFESARIEARVVDKHYALYSRDTVRQTEELIGIVDMANPRRVIARMYDEAKKIAKETAKADNNKFVDDTKKRATSQQVA